MSWILTSVNWYLYLLFLGIIFFPITKKILGRFSFDSGYAFSKIIAILFISYSSFALGFLKILPFERTSLFLLIGCFIFINLYFLQKDLKKNLINWQIIIFEELLFLISLIAWAYVRGQEPSIHSLEKFMDFGFINSILKTKYFPPLDMWYSGYPINYYYFGHLTGAFLIKLSGTLPYIGYNLILSTIFALGVTQVFSLTGNIVYFFLKKLQLPVFIGLITAFIVNLGGNLHTIYLFTKGYTGDTPIPFWQILSGFNPTIYWYPNATRFIPFTIHEFPSYSYVVADLHGHVFDIPFVLFTLAILFLFFIGFKENQNNKVGKVLNSKFIILNSILLGFLTAVHYMTNAFDGPIYLLLTIIIFLFVYKLSYKFIFSSLVLIASFLIFSFPFSSNFTPFVSGIGVNCAPDFLVKLGKLGPFLFENGKCQATPFWMLFVLWGFFWVSLAIFIIIVIDSGRARSSLARMTNNIITKADLFILILFSFGTFLIIIPIFFYIKDIYPAHFRANTVFKLGYQAYIMMGIASGYVFFRIKFLQNFIQRMILKIVFLFFFSFVAIYFLFAIPSYYGTLSRQVDLNGAQWLMSSYPDDWEIINFINNRIEGQPVILEAQGDSYTDYERISAYTGVPTVAGWWVHEWLWRGSPDVVGKRIPDIVNIYESNDLNLTSDLIKKYNIQYVIISELEKQKYKNLNETKFNQLGKIVFKSSSGKGAIYQLN